MTTIAHFGSDRVVVGVDTHKDEHVAVAIDGLGARLGEHRLQATSDGYEDLAKLTGHSCLTPVAELAKTADVGRLILVHVNPLATPDEVRKLESARAIFSALEIGCDKMIVDL